MTTGGASTRHRALPHATQANVVTTDVAALVAPAGASTCATSALAVPRLAQQSKVEWQNVVPMDVEGNAAYAQRLHRRATKVTVFRIAHPTAMIRSVGLTAAVAFAATVLTLLRSARLASASRYASLIASAENAGLTAVEVFVANVQLETSATKACANVCLIVQGKTVV